MQHLLLLITTMSACVASAMHIEKRDVDNPLVCQTAEKCVSSYNTGSAQCRAGYDATHYTARGDPVGTYCEKPCDESERSRCTALRCTFYETQCTAITAGTGTICGDALKWCGRPIRTTKDNCNQGRMGQPVKYDDGAGTCAFDPNAPKDAHSLGFIIGARIQAATHLGLICTPVSSAGIQSIAAEMTKVAKRCSQDSVPKNTSPYKINWHCYDTSGNYDKFQQVFKDACAAAEHPGDTAPVFEAYRG
jgi:hypothetical protein